MERATISRQQQTQRAFLGAALMDPARAREYIIKLVPGMFDEGVSRAVFSAVQQLTMAGEPVDVITVINRASAGRPADEIRPGVVAMAETCPSVSNVGSYAAQILEDYRYSLLQGDLLKCMAKDAMDSDGVCRQLRRTLAVQDAIRSTQTDSTARDFDAVLDSALARLDEPDDSLKLGWPELDRYGVFGRQRVCVVAGRPGCGKTDFSLNLAARLSKRYKVYYLTLEETAEALMDRILSKVARIDSGKLTNKSLAPREREIINNAAARLRQHHNMMLDADSNLTIDGLEAKLMQYKPDIAFIDHIGLLSPTDPRQPQRGRGDAGRGRHHGGHCEGRRCLGRTSAALRHANAKGQPHDTDGQRPAAVPSEGRAEMCGRGLRLLHHGLPAGLGHGQYQRPVRG